MSVAPWADAGVDQAYPGGGVASAGVVETPGVRLVLDGPARHGYEVGPPRHPRPTAVPARMAGVATFL